MILRWYIASNNVVRAGAHVYIVIPNPGRSLNHPAAHNHTIEGAIVYPADTRTSEIAPGLCGTDSKERHRTFEVKMASGGTIYYFLNIKIRVVGCEVLAAFIEEAKHLTARSHKRDAETTRQGWHLWREKQAHEVALLWVLSLLREPKLGILWSLPFWDKQMKFWSEIFNRIVRFTSYFIWRS